MGDKNTLKQEEILSKGYGIIPKFVMKDKELSAEAKAIYAYLCSYSGAGDTAFPSVELMCNDLKMSRNRFEKHRKDLIDRGYIVISRKRLESGFSNNIYQLPKVLSLQSVPLQNVAVGNVALQNEATNSNSLNINNLNSNSTNKKDPSSNRNSMASDFDIIWKIYPKKTLKKEGLAAYERAIKKGVDKRVIYDGVKNYLKYLEINKDWLPVMDGGRWFQKERWNDEYDLTAKPKRNTGYQKALIRKEPIPDWMDKPQQTKGQEDPAVKAELQRRLAEYQRKKAENDGA